MVRGAARVRPNKDMTKPDPFASWKKWPRRLGNSSAPNGGCVSDCAPVPGIDEGRIGKNRDHACSALVSVRNLSMASRWAGGRSGRSTSLTESTRARTLVVGQRSSRSATTGVAPDTAPGCYRTVNAPRDNFGSWLVASRGDG